MIKEVSIRNLHHRNQDCIGIFFPYQKEIMAVTKAIPGVKFSITHKCWYVQHDEHAFDSIFDTFKKNNIWVDYSTLNKHPEQSALAILRKPLNAAIELARTQVTKQLKLKGYSENTLRVYDEQFKLFTNFYPDSNPEDIGFEEIQAYMLYLIEDRKLSKSTQNQAINAIKFYFEKVLKQEQKVYYIERPFKERKLPNVLSQEEVLSIFETSGNLKHRLMLMLIYSAGLRRSELLNLRVADIDFARLTVRIKQAKGKKDRQSILARSIIPMLQQYLDEYNPVHWLFTGQDGALYSASSLQKVLKEAVRKSGINRFVTLHTLRHSFATHLLESGTSTRYIQVLLGHESPKTTEIYAHVTRFGLDKLRSPLDQMAVENQFKRIEE